METTKLKKMIKNIEDALTAVSFAEEGQTASARSIMEDGRRVLLALKEGRIDSKTLKYALNTAKRINAHLDILYITATNGVETKVDPVIRDFETELLAEGITYRLIRRTGSSMSAAGSSRSAVSDATVSSSSSTRMGCR